MSNPTKTKKQRIKELEERVFSLELRLLALESKPVAPNPYQYPPTIDPLPYTFWEVTCEARS